MIQLRRRTSGGGWLPEIDGLRFIAIATVLCTHIYSHVLAHGAWVVAFRPQYARLTQWTIHDIGAGVPLFFVISGFILSRPFVRQYRGDGKRVDLKFYYLRRVTRLEPPYLLSLGLYTASLLLFRAGTRHNILLSLLSSCLYLHNAFLKTLPAINFVTWSLEIEVQFYLVAPIIAQLFRLRSATLRRGSLVVLALASAWAPFAMFLPTYACFFLMGYLLADLRIDQRREWSSAWWELASVPLWFLILWHPPLRGVVGHWSRVWDSAVLFCGFAVAMLAPYTRRLLAVRPLAILGGMCYSIYLMHMLVISAVYPFTRRFVHLDHFGRSMLAQYALLLPCILLVSMVYFILIERPCMNPEWPRAMLRFLRLGSHGTRVKQAPPPSMV